MENGTLSITLPRHLFKTLNPQESDNRGTLSLVLNGIGTVEANIWAKSYELKSDDRYFMGEIISNPAEIEIMFDMFDIPEIMVKKDNFPFARTCAKISSDNDQQH